MMERRSIPCGAWDMRKPQPAPLLGWRCAARVLRARCARSGSWPRRGGARVGALALAALAAAGAVAQGGGERATPGLEVATLVEILAAGPDGTAAALVALAPAAAPEPGASLVYTVKFKNTSGGAVDDVRITKPVQPGVRYVAGSASGPGSDVLFSVDGGLTFRRPDELTVP